MMNVIHGWTVDQQPHHVDADRDHRPIPDYADANCTVCGFAIVPEVPAHGFAP